MSRAMLQRLRPTGSGPRSIRAAAQPAAVFPLTMPAAHRERYYASSPKPFTFNPEPRSRSAGIGVHVALETPITMSRNTHLLRT